MGEMCGPIEERHGRDMWSNRRGMGEMCGPFQRHGGDVWSNMREAWERYVVQ